MTRLPKRGAKLRPHTSLWLRPIWVSAILVIVHTLVAPATLGFSTGAARAQQCAANENALRVEALASGDFLLSEQYLACFSHSEHASVVIAHLERLTERSAYDEAIAQGTAAPLIEFIKRFPGSERRQDALARIEELSHFVGYRGSRLVGQTLRTTPMEEAIACRDSCIGDSACAGFTYFVDRKACSLWASVTHHSSDPTAISGSRRNVPEAPNDYVYYRGNTIIGQVLDSGRTDDAMVCRDACTNRDRCEGFTFFQDRNICSLWNTITQRAEDPTAVSGTRREIPSSQSAPPPSAPSSGFAYFPGVDFRYGDLLPDPIRDVSQAQCEHYCVNDQRCIAYTYNQERHACFPKNAVLSQVPFAGAMSATKRGFGQQAPTASAMEIHRDVDLPNQRSTGHDYGHYAGIGAQACSQRCEMDGRCRAFTYNTHYQVCILKSAVSRAVRFQGAVSGIKR